LSHPCSPGRVTSANTHSLTELTQHADAEFPELTTAEKSLFDALKNNRFGKNIRMEQERIAWNGAMAALLRAVKHMEAAASSGRKIES